MIKTVLNDFKIYIYEHNVKNIQIISYKFFLSILQKKYFCTIFTLIYLINSKILLHNWKILCYKFLLLRGHLDKKISFSGHLERFLRLFGKCLNFQDFWIKHHIMKMDWNSTNSWRIFNFFVPKSIYFFQGVKLK